MEGHQLWLPPAPAFYPLGWWFATHWSHLGHRLNNNYFLLRILWISSVGCAQLRWLVCSTWCLLGSQIYLGPQMGLLGWLGLSRSRSQPRLVHVAAACSAGKNESCKVSQGLTQNLLCHLCHILLVKQQTPLRLKGQEVQSTS